METENCLFCLALESGSNPYSFGNCRIQGKAASSVVMGVSKGGGQEEMENVKPLFAFVVL